MMRHRWFKLGLHRYICRRCGAGYVNSQRGRDWIRTFFLPTGETTEGRTPPCQTGRLTKKYLSAYAGQIAAADAVVAAVKADARDSRAAGREVRP